MDMHDGMAVRAACTAHRTRKRRPEGRRFWHLRDETRRAGAVAGASRQPWIRNSSTERPAAVNAASQRGCLPRPVQVSAGLSGLRNFGGTLPSDLRERGALALAAALGAADDGVPPNTSSAVYPSAFSIAASFLRTTASGLRLARRVFCFLAAWMRASSSFGDSESILRVMGFARCWNGIDSLNVTARQ